ncbi:hypothetical protein BST61_g8151 [Cercospora zeina]
MHPQTETSTATTISHRAGLLLHSSTKPNSRQSLTKLIAPQPKNAPSLGDLAAMEEWVREGFMFEGEGVYEFEHKFPSTSAISACDETTTTVSQNEV